VVERIVSIIKDQHDAHQSFSVVAGGVPMSEISFVLQKVVVATLDGIELEDVQRKRAIEVFQNVQRFVGNCIEAIEGFDENS
jgi:hypothetical protein